MDYDGSRVSRTLPSPGEAHQEEERSVSFSVQLTSGLSGPGEVLFDSKVSSTHLGIALDTWAPCVTVIKKQRPCKSRG